MSDSRLRDLERRWKETGTVEDEATYLVERMRTRDLTPEALALAAYCGHEAALVAGAAAPPQPSKNLSRWVKGLARWGEAAFSRAALSAAFHVLGHCESVPASSIGVPRDAVRRVLLAAVDLVLEPSRPRLIELSRRSQRLAWPGQTPPVQTVLWAALASGARLEGGADEDRLVCASRAAVEASRSAAETESSVQMAISHSLTKWALGRGDPLVAIRDSLTTEDGNA